MSMKSLPASSSVIVIPLCLLMKMPKGIRYIFLELTRSRRRWINCLTKRASDAGSLGSISLEIMTALFLVSLTFAAFITVTDHLKHQGYLLRVRGEGVAALSSRYEMASLGVPFLPLLPNTFRVCQQESGMYQHLWLSIAAVGQRADCNIPDSMSLVLRTSSL
ncbi:hypothetical protein LMG33818_002270 [Halomonadaceae bacterium LMG 33818]|uniref:hypothetical protein n=1 Tax=Cernens ardua TaxID=3402176 RepID=UPI003EDB93F9